MARPKRNENEPSALDRIETAFWEMLSEMPYESITIAALAKRANVNHNTIYYYYESIDQMALALFEKDIPDDIAPLFISIITSGQSIFHEVQKSADLQSQWKKAYLFLKSDSPLLLKYLKSKIFEAWCGSLGVKESDLADMQRMELEFIFGGLTAALRYSFEAKDPSKISSLADRPLGQAIFSTLADMKCTAGASRPE